jgi:hypothetical protein
LAFGLANTFGRVATIVASSMVTVDSVVYLWMNVAGSLFIIILTLYLPETKGLELKDMICEVE